MVGTNWNGWYHACLFNIHACVCYHSCIFVDLILCDLCVDLRHSQGPEDKIQASLRYNILVLYHLHLSELHLLHQWCTHVVCAWRYSQS